MENKKNTTMRTIQITYPAPYSQSWNADQQTVLTKNSGKSAKTFPRFFNSPKRQSPRASSLSHSTVRGLDTTAPHLKYGVFPNRRVSSSRALPRSLPKSLYSPKNNCPREKPADFLSNKALLPKRKPTRKPPLTETPVLVFRSLDKRFTKQLSRSETMHVEIKPKRNITVTPNYGPAPSFKILSPKLTVTPLRSPR